MFVFPSIAGTTGYVLFLPHEEVVVQDDNICLVRGDAHILTILKDA